jgi:hypothetical protein
MVIPKVASTFARTSFTEVFNDPETLTPTVPVAVAVNFTVPTLFVLL